MEHEDRMGYEGSESRYFYYTTSKQVLPCCALCQITAGNRTSMAELEAVIDKLKVEAKRENKRGKSYGVGQRACFVIVSPGEYHLEKKLIILKFELITTFSRRVGYEPGLLKMYFLKW